MGSYIFGLIISGILLKKLRDKYYVKSLKDPKVYTPSLFISAFLVGPCHLWVFLLIGWIVLKNTGVLDNMQQNGYEQEMRNQYLNNPYARGMRRNPRAMPMDINPADMSFDSTTTYNLPVKQKKREKIIEKTNKKYRLSLTSAQIECIAAASYISPQWAAEVKSMEKNYNNIYEWFTSGNTWLKVYLYAFNKMDISSLFYKQEQIVYQTFDTIFSEMCIDDTLPTEVVIENINNKYLTNFDELSFMQAINYMESKGKRYRFGAPVLTKVNSEIENLQRKYDH